MQFAGLLFKWIDDETYQLMRSCNVYISQKVCYPFAEYTAITNNFLEENGIPLNDAKELIKEFAHANWDRVSFYNTLNKYAERDKNGKFTGNFVAPVNQGAAEAEFKEFRENLQKEMKLKKDQFGDLIFESDDDWKEYNI